MLKYAFLAGAMAVSSPALAQDVPIQDSTAGQDVPVTQDTAPVPGQALPDTTAPAPESDVQAEAESTLQADASASQQATPEQIEQLVESQFATYDKDGTGELSEEQFGEWMVALRSASEPTLQPGSPEVESWIGQAFAQADADNSSGVSKEELTGFLAPGAS